MLRLARIRPRPRPGADRDRRRPHAARGGRGEPGGSARVVPVRPTMLLVLDNFEQVASAATVVAELLAACPLLEALATSRGTCAVRRARIYRRTTHVADPEYRHGTRALGAYPESSCSSSGRGPCVRISALRRRTRRRSARSVPASTVCRRRSNRRLAWVRPPSPAEIVPRLAHPFELLTGGPLSTPTASARWLTRSRGDSALLDRGAGTMFTRLGVFAGGFTVDAAEAVAGEPGAAGVIEALAALIGLGLVQRPVEMGPASLLEAARDSP